MSLEINDLKSDQIIKDYEDRDSFGDYLKNNNASREFEKTEIFKKLQMDVTDLAMNIKNAEFQKVDIDMDTLTKNDISEIYKDSKQPNSQTKICYIFKMHYYHQELDKDVPVYVKFNFDINFDKNHQLRECLVIKSFHLDDQTFGSKIHFDKDMAHKAELPEFRNYDFVNEWDYEQVHENSTNHEILK